MTRPATRRTLRACAPGLALALAAALPLGLLATTTPTNSRNP